MTIPAERAFANTLLHRHWTGKTLPIEPREIAEAEGVKVLPVSPTKLVEASGKYTMVGSTPTILFNAYENETRQRFTIAHELGHHVLDHGPRPRDSIAEFNIYDFDPVESAANKFAIELLMPFLIVHRLVEKHAMTSLTPLAEIFKVSEEVMRVRLKLLAMSHDRHIQDVSEFCQ